MFARRIGKSFSGETICVEWTNGTICRVEPVSQSEGTFLFPALVDAQVNGYAGVDLNHPEVSSEAISAMARALWATGVGIFFPTVVTGPPEQMLRSLRVIRQACREDESLEASVGGFHVEGPFISPEEGPRGAHRAEWVRPPSWEEFCRWQEAAEGTVRLVTLSPEWENAPRFIERVVATGVRVAIGHTKATSEQLRAAVDAGATLSTHLGNGAHAFLPRHPNYIWEQAAEDRLWASLIADGHHLPPATFKCLLRAKTVERTFLVSDVVSFGGMGAGSYRGWDGKRIEVLSNGRVQLAGTPYLAGAGLPLIRGVENAMRFGGLSLGEAFGLATSQPARFFGLSGGGKMEEKAPAHLIRVGWDPERGSLTVLETIVAGKVFYKR